MVISVLYSYVMLKKTEGSVNSIHAPHPSYMSTNVESIVNLVAVLIHFMTATTTTLFGRLGALLLARTHILH